MMMEQTHLIGTYFWYYAICQRELWLMSRQLDPDQDNALLDIGRFIHDTTYVRDRKEIQIGHLKLDIVRVVAGKVIVCEVKKSSSYLESSRMQLLFYLDELRKMGIDAEGEILVPEEKIKEQVLLTEESQVQLERTKEEMYQIIYQESPPPVAECAYCKRCAYQEFCWS